MRNYVRVIGEAAEEVEPPYAVGDKVSFSPSCFTQALNCCYLLTNLSLHGQVVYVNKAHRYYTAEAECNGHTIRESYKY